MTTPLPAEAASTAPEKTPIADPALRESHEITFDDFVKVDLRVGTVEAAERVPKSTKLLKLTVDFGGLGQRQILAGIGKSFEPAALLDKQFLFVVNLPVREMMGLPSHGMILATGESNALTLMVPSQIAFNGSRLG